jgi:hypothetical protein
VPFGSSNLAIIKIIKRRKTEETILIRNGQTSHFLQWKLVERMMYMLLRELKIGNVVLIATRSKILGWCYDRYAI